MTKLATMIRRAASSFRLYCEMCRKETMWRFVTEDARMEYYRCDQCKHTKGWAVR
jgi:predicted RNA-binding Zn-ribbon protein involved in translation (DUF1610 family)